MELLEKVGHLDIYTEQDEESSILDELLCMGDENVHTIIIKNGNDVVAHETYFNSSKLWSAEDLMRKVFDSYTMQYLLNSGMEYKSGNLFELEMYVPMLDEIHYFRRWSRDSRYYKHYAEPPMDWGRMAIG